MSYRVHTQTDRTTNLLISSNVHYVHLGGDNQMLGVIGNTLLWKILNGVKCVYYGS